MKGAVLFVEDDAGIGCDVGHEDRKDRDGFAVRFIELFISVSLVKCERAKTGFFLHLSERGLPSGFIGL